MEVELRVSGPAEAMRSLEVWMAGRDELRGRARPVVVAPGPAEMGSAAEVLVVALGHGGAATALASVLVSWIRRQRGTISLTAKRSDGAAITVSADHVRGLTSERIPELVAELTAALDGSDAHKVVNGGAGALGGDAEG
jgi:hypothetical protein